jgi:hypothetical protein
MRQVYGSAFKHGVAKADIKHVLKHAIRIIDQDDGSLLYLGAAINQWGAIGGCGLSPTGWVRAGGPRHADAIQAM